MFDYIYGLWYNQRKYKTQYLQNITKWSGNMKTIKVADRMTLVAASMVATTILGSAYMCKDKDYYQTRESLLILVLWVKFC